MDPYHILGVSRRCTREEVKETFRARVRYAHPDRGGNEETFIRLCAAYKQILKELDQHARWVSWKPTPAAGDAGPSVPPGRSWKTGRGTVDEAIRSDRPLKPPDPDWVPDLVVDDRPPLSNRLSVPPDPDWVPDLIVSDKGSPVSRPQRPRDPGLDGRNYRSWLRQVSDHIARRESIWQSRRVRIIGMMILLSILGGNLWLCWVAWTYDPKKAARQAELAAQRSQSTETQEPSGSQP
jgi:DnaJ domain